MLVSAICPDICLDVCPDIYPDICAGRGAHGQMNSFCQLPPDISKLNACRMFREKIGTVGRTTSLWTSLDRNSDTSQPPSRASLFLFEPFGWHLYLARGIIGRISRSATCFVAPAFQERSRSLLVPTDQFFVSAPRAVRPRALSFQFPSVFFSIIGQRDNDPRQGKIRSRSLRATVVVATFFQAIEQRWRSIDPGTRATGKRF